MNLFEANDYKAYLIDRLGSVHAGRGSRSRLAVAVGCNTAFVSQVLNGHSHFSLEQAHKINGFFGHSKDQATYFLTLVQLNRAGTTELKDYFADQIQEQRLKQQDFKHRLSFKSEVTKEDQFTFYSSWIYGAIHVLVSVPECRTEKGLIEYLGLPTEIVSSACDFLERMGMIRRGKNGFEIGISHIHLGNDSTMISKHHLNWRLRAMLAIERNQAKKNLHYSSVITCSFEDSEKIKNIMAAAIDKIRAIVRDSRDEGGFCYLLDFFPLKN